MIPAWLPCYGNEAWAVYHKEVQGCTFSDLVKLYKNGTATNGNSYAVERLTISGDITLNSRFGYGDRCKNVYTFKELDSDEAKLEDGATLDINNRHFTDALAMAMNYQYVQQRRGARYPVMALG